MISSYETAKRVALGLEAEAAALPVGDDLWSITPVAGFGLAAEMPFQYFEKGFDPPDELTTQKAALMVGYIEEYTEDQRAAEKRLKTLKRLLAGGDAEGLRKLLNDAPPAQWLSMIFLEGGTLRDE